MTAMGMPRHMGELRESSAQTVGKLIRELNPPERSNGKRKGYMQTKYKTEYQVVRWESPEELAQLMTDLQAKDWRTELTRLYHQHEDEKGWTIFSRTSQVRPSLLDAEVKLSEIYSILNSTEVTKSEMDHAAEGERGYTGPTVREISRQIKAIYDLRYPEPEVTK